jgi:serine/threonine-protein kinase RsbW
VPAPDLCSPLEERHIGGLGIYLMTRLMDEVHFDFNPHTGNLLTMVKYIASKPGNDRAVVPLSGRLDAITAPQVRQQVEELIAQGVRQLVLDLADVTFLNSSGLRTLLLIRKELMTLGGELHLAAAQPQVCELFDMTGFIQVFSLHASVAEACAALKQQQV